MNRSLVLSNYTVYTAANDNRVDQLDHFLDYFEASNPNQKLKVILFDRDSPKVVKFCSQRNIPVVLPNRIIDLCAKSIFMNGEYRPGVKSWKYMRKLNCFLDATTSFLFLDLNCIPLAALDPLIDAYRVNEKDILFTTHSHAKRTLRVETKQFLSSIDPAIGEGYNCSIIASKNHILNESIFESLKGRNLRKMIAKAPEQGYLAIAMALSNISHGLFQHSDKLRSHYTCANKQVISQATLHFDHSSETIIMNNGKQNRTLMTYKSTGSKLTDLTPENLKIFEQLKLISRGSASARSDAKHSPDLAEANVNTDLSDQIEINQAQQKSVHNDSQYTLKLYSPFRSGSNLVKASLEHNFSNIHVLNTGDNHWKHAFHVQSKNYFGYIYCIRHPLNLVYSIRDYYHKVGRNIHSHGSIEDFFYAPISIYNEGIHQGRSPMLFPNPIALINSWYFNYLYALNRNQNRAAKILYEHMMIDQKSAIEEIIKSMNLNTQKKDFKSINAKTKNLGDRRFNWEKDLQGKIFDSNTTIKRHHCGLSDTNLLKNSNQKDIDFIIKEIDWSISNQLGYKEDGIIKIVS